MWSGCVPIVKTQPLDTMTSHFRKIRGEMKARDGWRGGSGVDRRDAGGLAAHLESRTPPLRGGTRHGQALAPTLRPPPAPHGPWTMSAHPARGQRP